MLTFRIAKKKVFKKTLINKLLYSHVPDITRSIQKRNNFIIQVYSPYTLIKESTQSQERLQWQLEIFHK